MKSKTLIALATATLMLPGCASIISGHTDDILVNTDPPGADCTLKRGTDIVGHANPTPTTVIVTRQAADIDISCDKPGYQTASAVQEYGMNGWVFGNILFGGVIGVLIDGFTGAQVGYDSEAMLTLAPKTPDEAPSAPQAVSTAVRPDEAPTS
jgi:hypothetical protein